MYTFEELYHIEDVILGEVRIFGTYCEGLFISS